MNSPLGEELAASDANNSKLAEQLANVLPRIHYICLHIGSNNGCTGAHGYWEVERCQDEVQLTLMDERAMERIRTRLWMFEDLV